MKKFVVFSFVASALLAQSTASLLDQANNNALALPEFVNAQGQGAVSMEKLISEILSTNPKVTAALNQLEISKKDKQIADNYYLPTLDLQASSGYSHTKAKVHDIRISPDAKGTTTKAALVLNENIFNGGRDKAIAMQQGALSSGAEYNLLQQANDIAYESAKAYMELIRASLKLDIAKKNLQAHEDIYRLIKDRTSSGFARASEERQAGSRLALARTNLLSAQNDYADAKQTLTKFYGSPIDASDLVMPVVNASMPSTLSELNEESFKCNPSLKVKEFNTQAADEGTKVARGAFMPRVDAQLSAGWQNDRTRKEIDQDSKATNLEAKLILNYNLFNKNADKLNLEKAKLAHLTASALGDDLKRDLEESNTFAMDSYEIAKQKVDYLKDYVRYAKETLLTYQDEFKLGKRDLLNLLDAQSEYFSSARESVDADNKLMMAKYKILQNKGVLMDYFSNGFNRRFVASSCQFAN